MTKVKVKQFIYGLGILFLFSCGRNTPVSFGAETITIADAGTEKPYLILISLDGFRWDYVDRFKPPHLSNFIKNGVRTESLIPSFPSKTFPNHYTIATGMYPDKHGILGNLFYSYQKDLTYNIRERDKVEDGEFYQGSPIWLQATKAGMVSASYFFVGTEANIQGVYPTYYYKYDVKVKNEEKVNQALKWLDMPAKERPHLITMYFPDMDQTGHSYGPNADEKLLNTALVLDTILGKLFQGIEKSGLPVNIIIVSDHGMKEIPVAHYIPIEKIKNEDLYLTVNNGSLVNIHPKDSSQIESILTSLRQQEDHFKAYTTSDTPYFEYKPTNGNWGAIQIIPDDGYYFSDIRSIGLLKGVPGKVYGQHGFDTSLKEMHGIFYANGPAFKKGYVIPSIKNIHIYPLMCHILGLEIPENIDGKLDQINPVLSK